MYYYRLVNLKFILCNYSKWKIIRPSFIKKYLNLIGQIGKFSLSSVFVLVLKKTACIFRVCDEYAAYADPLSSIITINVLFVTQGHY